MYDTVFSVDIMINFVLCKISCLFQKARLVLKNLVCLSHKFLSGSSYISTLHSFTCQIRIKFSWTEAFSKGGLFGGAKSACESVLLRN